MYKYLHLISAHWGSVGIDTLSFYDICANQNEINIVADNSLNSKVVKLIFSSFIFVYSLLSYDRITLFCLAHNESLIFALHVLALNVPYFLYNQKR